MSKYITNSDIIIISGSSVIIGKDTANAQLDISGSGIVSGSFTVTQGITGSLYGTSSWALNALTSSYIIQSISASYASSSTSASYATTASYVQIAQTASYYGGSVVSASYASSSTSASFAVLAQTANTASYVLQAVSSSYALTASLAPNYVLTSVTSSMLAPYVLTSQTSSMTVATASYVTGSVHNSTNPALSASYALTASYAMNGGGASFPYTGSAIITGSLVITGSTTSTLGFTGSLYGTASWASNAISSSYAVTASYVTGSIFTNSNLAASASYAVTASYAAISSNGGVTQLVAGSGISLSPSGGTGTVTVTSLGGSTYNTMTGSYGAFHDTGSYPITSTTTAYSASLGQTDITNGVYTNSDKTKIFFTNAGIYNVQFSMQFENSDANDQDVQIWLRQGNDGGASTDIAYSTGFVSVPGKHGITNGHAIPAWNYLLSIASNDYIQLMYQGSSTTITLATLPAGTTPTTPVTPSTILTANRVDTFLSNTGSFSGSFNGIFTGSLQGTSSWAVSSSQAVTASYIQTAQTASYVQNAISASYVLQAVSSSYSTLAQTSNTASYVVLAQTASYVLQAVSASYVLQAVSASYVLQAVSSSYSTLAQTANTASYVTGSIHNSTNPALSASYALSSSWAENGGVTQIIAGTNITLSPTNGLGAVTINSTGGGGSSTQIATGSVTASVSPSQFSVVSGSSTEFVVTGTGVTLGNVITDTHRVTGSLNISGSVLLSAGNLTDGQNALRLTATMPTVITSTNSAVDYQITSAGGSSSQTNGALNIAYIAGYTGSNTTFGINVNNTVAGTGTDFFGTRNMGIFGQSSATTTGYNNGVYGSATNGDKNIGVIGRTITSKNSATNVGVAGFSLNIGTNPTQVGGFFGLMNSVPTFSSTALMCDNGSTTDPIFVARDNGTAVFTIADGGNINSSGSITSPSFSGSFSGSFFGNGSGLTGVTATADTTVIEAQVWFLT